MIAFLFGKKKNVLFLIIKKKKKHPTMPNHTMFLKYSRKRETRGQSCQGFVLQRERATFLFPLASRGVRAGNRAGSLTAFLRTTLRDSNVASSLRGGGGGGGSPGGEVCAHRRGQVWKPPEMTP